MKSLGVMVLLLIGGCEKSASPSKSSGAGATATTAAATGTNAPTPPRRAEDGSRIVDIVAGDAYAPAEIVAAPGEALTLSIKRVAEGCIETLKLPDGRSIALPKDQLVAVPVKAPASGELHFGCDMEHCHEGKIVVKL